MSTSAVMKSHEPIFASVPAHYSNFSFLSKCRYDGKENESLQTISVSRNQRQEHTVKDKILVFLFSTRNTPLHESTIQSGTACISLKMFLPY